MWVLAAGILGLVAGALLALLANAETLDQAPFDKIYIRNLKHKVKEQEESIERLTDILSLEIDEKQSLESRHSQLSQILNGVPLNEVQ